MEKRMIFGERLKKLIKAKAKEQQEVAVELGINPVTFSGYVINKREPSFERLRLFAQYFGVSTDYLLGSSDISNPTLTHLTKDLEMFVREPENSGYIELARDIKIRTTDIRSINDMRSTKDAPNLP